MRLFDAHCHLCDPRLVPWREAALGRARAAGVLGFACCGTEDGDWEAVLALAQSEPDVLPFLGLHPWSAGAAAPGWVERLEALAAPRPWVGIGECGLDRLRAAAGTPEAAVQEAALLAQVGLARRLGRPVALHGVRAWARVLELLLPLGPHPQGYLLHAFAGPAELVPPLAALGAWFSFAGTVTRHGASRVRAAARAVPAERMLVETDAPDILPIAGPGLADPALPRDAEGRPLNAPHRLAEVLRGLAQARGEPEEAVAERCLANAQALFEPLLAGKEPA